MQVDNQMSTAGAVSQPDSGEEMKRKSGEPGNEEVKRQKMEGKKDQ